MQEKFSQFYIFTGKGGVGKTTLSLAFCKQLQEETKKKVKLVYFRSNKIENDSSFQSFEDMQFQQLQNEGIEIEGLELRKSIQEYMARKLKSKTISSWILKTPFFTSLVNMLPGFNFVVYLGQILDDLNDDPDQIVVLDAPASGHALTMLQAVANFKEIFQSGIVYNDTKKIFSQLTDPNLLKIIIITLPTQLSVNEAKELKSDLNEIGYKNIQLITNSSFLYLENDQELPHFLIEKIKIEKELLNDSISTFKIPFSSKQTIKDLSSEIASSTKVII